MFLRVLYILVLFSFSVSAQTLLDVPKFRIYPGTLTQTEPVAVTHPQNSSFIFASAVTINVSNGFRSEGVYISDDGGFTWTGNDTCTGQLIINHGGDPGAAVMENGRLILTHIGLQFPGIYSNYSDDLGETWSSNNTITENPVEDKGTLAVDHSPQSNYPDRLYLAYVDYINVSVQSSISTDKGESWSQPMQINPNPPTRSTGSSIAIGTDGTVYMCWAGVKSSTDFREDYIGFATSTNGGQNWSYNQSIIDMTGITGLLSQKSNIRVNSIPQIVVDKSGGPREGWLYIITTEKNDPPAGSDPDIILYRSTDGGTNWSSGIRVNQDPLNNGRIQYFPYLEIDELGNLGILFYDDRNTTSDSADVFIAFSGDGGNNWSEFQLKNTTFKPKPISGGSSGYQGDHIALLSVNGNFNAYWMADYTGIYQVWSSVIDRTILGTEDNVKNTPHEFSLYQNYPNPFNPATTIKYSLGKESFVALKIYDSTGRLVSTLVNKTQSAGTYEVNFKPENLSSGIYLYSLRTGDYISTKKMLFLK